MSGVLNVALHFADDDVVVAGDVCSSSANSGRRING